VKSFNEEKVRLDVLCMNKVEGAVEEPNLVWMARELEVKGEGLENLRDELEAAVDERFKTGAGELEATEIIIKPLKRFRH